MTVDLAACADCNAERLLPFAAVIAIVVGLAVIARKW